MSEKNEFDYSTIDTCGVAVIVVLAVSAFFAIFLIFALSQVNNLTPGNPGQVASQKAGDFHAKNSDTEELIFHEFILNEAISNDW